MAGQRLQASDYLGFSLVGLTVVALVAGLVRQPDSLVMWVFAVPLIVGGVVLMLHRWRLISNGTPRI